jgi:S1-C subfamily serine protease
MFCDNCGQPVEEGARYCDNCGAVVGSVGSSLKKSILNSWTKVNKFLTRRIVISGIVILVLCIIGYKFLADYEQSQKLLLTQQQALSSAQQEITNLAANASSSATIAQEEAAQASSSEGMAEQAQNEAAKAQSEATRAAGNTIDVSSLVSEWSPSIPVVDCTFPDGTGQGGSGTLIQFKDGTYEVVTNLHVVYENSVTPPTSCEVNFLNDPENLYYPASDITPDFDGSDMAEITITNPDSYVSDNQVDYTKFCQNEPSIGDSVLVLGYPGIGADESITATEGIISGYNGNYYVTSATVGHGNSGGAAIDEKNDCYLGIPTYVENDGIASLAGILKWQAWY